MQSNSGIVVTPERVLLKETDEDGITPPDDFGNFSTESRVAES